METCINYDEYDAFILGYDYHTGFPKPINIETDINPLNTIDFMLNYKKEYEALHHTEQNEK